MEKNEKLEKFLKDFTFINKKGKVCGFNTIQAHDLGLLLQHPLGLLNWSQGSGKTPAAFSQILWTQKILWTHQNKPDTTTFIIGPPISVRATWKEFYESQKLHFVVLEQNSDIENIAPGSVVLLPLSKLKSLKRQLVKFLKGKYKKINLVFDECDEISNFASSRARMMMQIFRKVPRKLLTTGTPTRNNLAEFYSVVAFLYNHSYMCIDRCHSRYREDKDKESGETYVTSYENSNQGKPFPAYGGWAHFKSCFSPSRKTVFGIGKHGQDVYNAEALESILNYTVITRKFSEIAGEGKYKVNTRLVRMAPWEEEVREKLMNEFSTLVHQYYGSTGNYRKDAMLRIIRQLKSLILSCSRPQKFHHTSLVPSKLTEVLDMVEGMNERVMIGSTTINSAAMYATALTKKFPGRKVWLVNGKDFTVQERQAVVDEFEKTTDGILVSTQQSLSSSLNIPFCNQVIIESLQWNYPRVSQYMMRAIRFDSEQPTNVHFVIYEDSIEVNIMMLMMEKEKLNDFLKTKTLRETKDVMQDFSVGEWLLDMVTKKVKDDEGKVRLVAGKQKLVA